jgi:hypothetical protein
MSDLLRLLGQENLDRMSEVAGGTRLFVPRHYGKTPGGGRDSSERLNRLFGESLAILLVFHFGDSEIYVPLPKERNPVDRRRLNRLARNRRLSANSIARMVGCTRRTVEKVRARQQALEQRR